MKTRLSDLYTLQMGKTPSRNVPEYWQGGTYQWASVSDLSQGGKYLAKTRERITEAAIEQSGIKEVPANTVVMSFKLSLGKVAITREPLFTNEAIMAFIPKDDRAPIAEYLFYQLQCHDWVKESANRAVMGVTLNKASLSKVEVTIPPKSEQERVTERLRHLDAQLHSCKITVNKLDELVKSRFIEMFGDPDNNPNDYPIRRLGDVVFIERGGSPRPISRYVTNGEDGVNWIKIGDTSEDSIYILKTKEKIIRSGTKKSRYVQPGDFLLSNSMSFGRPYILKTDGCIHDGWLVLRDSSNVFDKMYLYALLDSEYAKRFFAKKAVGTTVRNLNKEIVGNMPVLLPPSAKQIEYADFFAGVDKLRFDDIVVLRLYLKRYRDKYTFYT